MLNIANILNTIKGILLGYYTSNSPAIITILNQYKIDSEKTFTDIATGVLNKNAPLSFADVTAAVKAQAIILKGQLESVGEIIAGDLETIISNALNVFEDALKAIIPASTV